MTKRIQMAAVEQETIITWNRAEDTAYIFTYEPTWQRHLEAMGCPLVMDNKCGGKEYAIDKKRIPMPRKKKVFSEAQIADMRDRARERFRRPSSKQQQGKNNNFGHPSEEAKI